MVLQLTTLVPVIVTAVFAKTRPATLPPVMVMLPPAAVWAPASMFPVNSGGSVEVDNVVSAPTAQNTLHGCAPLVMTTWNPLPVRAAPTLKIQIPFGFVDPSSVNVVFVNVTAAGKQ
jgi:hypothetical protein